MTDRLVPIVEGVQPSYERHVTVQLSAWTLHECMAFVLDQVEKEHIAVPHVEITTSWFIDAPVDGETTFREMGETLDTATLQFNVSVSGPVARGRHVDEGGEMPPRPT